VTLAESVEISDGHATVRRIIEGGSMDLRMPLPCMLSIAPTASALRGRNMKSAVKLKKQITKNDRDRDVFKEDSTVFTLLSVDEVGLEEHLIGLGGSPTIVAAAPAVEKVSRDLATAADVDELVDIVEGWE
jgi:electron transfer flavoprotein alpha/beta subunit